jgi:predicted PurR-regulated permease PerM
MTGDNDDGLGGVTRPGLTRATLGVICMLLLIAGSAWVLRPFFAATVWATMLVVATWPMLQAVQRRLGNRRGPAVAVMTVGMLLLIVVPLWAAVDTIAGRVDDVRSIVKEVAKSGIPDPPSWVSGLPVVGKRVGSTWQEWADADQEVLRGRLEPHARDAARWLLQTAGSLGGTVVQFLLIVILSAVMYSGGESAARAVRQFGRRLAGDPGEAAVILAGKAIRSVALGVGVTAIVQTALGGIGLAIAGVPFATVLSAVMLMLCIAQVGPALVLVPSVVWLYWSGSNGWGTFMLLWSLLVGTMDNFMRPLLIKKGADLPLLLIFAGVIGGLIGFGLIGLFVGPVLLAVTYTLLGAWVNIEVDSEGRITQLDLVAGKAAALVAKTGGPAGASVSATDEPADPEG